MVLSSCVKKGCTDSTANNYNPSAKKDNGLCTYSVTDIDGNSYKGLVIGNQVWMIQKNLAVKKYRNGDLIPQVQDDSEWYNLTTGAWCYYENDPDKGILYNWYAVNDPRGLAPDGWHIPTNTEWDELNNYLGDDAGIKMKSSYDWDEDGNTNESKFWAEPLGERLQNGFFWRYGFSTTFWSSSINYGDNFGNIFCASLMSGHDYLSVYPEGKENGFSVRCIKD